MNQKEIYDIRAAFDNLCDVLNKYNRKLMIERDRNSILCVPTNAYGVEMCVEHPDTQDVPQSDILTLSSSVDGFFADADDLVTDKEVSNEEA